jgi:hypothetical protein
MRPSATDIQFIRKLRGYLAMAKISAEPQIHFELTVKLSEAETRALDALAGYGDDAFIKAFYEKLGTAYMKPHEAGLREFLKTIRILVPGQLTRLDAARSTFKANSGEN